jgi:hypothetical protein
MCAPRPGTERRAHMVATQDRVIAGEGIYDEAVGRAQIKP